MRVAPVAIVVLVAACSRGNTTDRAGADVEDIVFENADAAGCSPMFSEPSTKDDTTYYSYVESCGLLASFDADSNRLVVSLFEAASSGDGILAATGTLVDIDCFDRADEREFLNYPPDATEAGVASGGAAIYEYLGAPSMPGAGQFRVQCDLDGDAFDTWDDRLPTGPTSSHRPAKRNRSRLSQRYWKPLRHLLPSRLRQR